MRRCFTVVLLAGAAIHGENEGLRDCRCLEFTGLATYMYNKKTLDHHTPEGEDHIFYRRCIHPSMPWSSENTTAMCYPRYYGEGVCWPWDQRRQPECADADGTPFWDAPPWCRMSWCYVPDDCEETTSKAVFFPAGVGGPDSPSQRQFSYATCSSSNVFELHGVPCLQFCIRYGLSEKPYVAILFSCILMALYDLALNSHHHYVQGGDEVTNLMRAFVVGETLLSLVNTVDIVSKIPFQESWDERGLWGLWQAYNLLAYCFIQSSTIMSCVQIAVVQYAWLDRNYFQQPVLAVIDAAYDEDMRPVFVAFTNLMIATGFLFPFIFVTHVVPGAIVYYWVVLVMAGGGWKLRQVAEMLSSSLSIVVLSFCLTVAIQMVTAAMVRIYDDGFALGYLAPLQQDIFFRRTYNYYDCYLNFAVPPYTIQIDLINLVF
jgi:hypothetical protein